MLVNTIVLIIIISIVISLLKKRKWFLTDAAPQQTRHRYKVINMEHSRTCNFCASTKNSLKSIFDDIKNNARVDLINNHEFITCLEHTALEDNVDEDVNVLMKRKQLAFRCLALLSNYDMNNDFCLTFVNSIYNALQMEVPYLIQSTAFQNLSGYITTCGLKEKVKLIQTLIICLTESKVNFSIFKEFPPCEWRIELLIFALLRDSTAHVDTTRDTVDIIIKSKINNDNSENLTETILEILLNNQNEQEFDIHFIYDVFFTIFDCHGTDTLTTLAYNFKQVPNEINQLKLLVLDRNYSEYAEYQRYEVELQYFLKYPWDVIRALVVEKTNNINDLLELKKVLEIVEVDKLRQIEIFRSQQPTDEPVIKWKHAIVYEIVKTVISDVFTAYGNYFLLVRNSGQQLESTSLVSDSKIKCLCHNLKKKTCVLHQIDKCCNLLYILNTTLARVLVRCCNITEKVIQVVEILITGINKDKRIIELINALDTLDEYDIQFTDTEFYSFFTEFTAEDYEQYIHKFVVDHSFPGTYEKSVDQLLNEIETTNPETTSCIVELFANIDDCFNKKSVLFAEKDNIKDWNESQIKIWSVLMKLSTKHRVPTEEKLAVIKRTAEVTLKLKLRDIQLLSVLIMINSIEKKGRLGQVNTGEGKTLIIATLAAYCVFIGHKVDIFTSSPVLAIPQSGEFKKFYDALGISMTHNILPNSDYNCDVVYGTNNSFQRDALKDDFRKTGVRKRRKFDVAIVDEVDNMLIDGNNWILHITSDMPAMDHLEVLLAAIYIQVKEAANSLIERDGTTYYLLQEDAIDDKGNVKPEIDVQEIPIEGSKKDFIIQATETHIRKVIRDTDNCANIDENYPEIKIPKHLREVVVKVQLRKWIISAINALFNYEMNEDYILRDSKITIVDAENTGVVKQNSHWGDGLHQFLEIKHGAKVAPENFTTNFISNVGLFTRYSKIYGLTGTLGSKDTINFLQNTYEVGSVIIPPYKLKQHVHLKDIVVNNEEDKYVEIAKSCIRKLRRGRAVLIIMKYIRETDHLAGIFKTRFNYDSTKIKLFKTDDEADIVTKPLKPGDVIITTNIAGRGTDIKLTKDVEQNGGLHVCLTFLPPNTRIEHQNIGRTSRKGYRGTSQYIICHPTCSEMGTLKRVRGLQEEGAMAGASETVKRVKAKERIFQKFCALLDNIKGRNTIVKATELKAVEERFGIWLVLNEDKLDRNKDQLLNSFNDFRNEIMKDDAENELIKNPYMYVELGNYYLKNKQFEQAIKEYTSAIILDHNFAENAYYNRAWAYIALYGCNINKYADFVNDAVRDLKKARKLIQDREYSLHLMQTASKGDVFSEQISHKLNIFSLQKNTIDLAIGPDVDAINEQLKNLREDAKNEKYTTDYKSKINEAIKNLEENKKDIGIIERAKRNNRNIRIESLGDDFMPKLEQESHKDEIEEFTRNGWTGAFKISEIKPIPWTSVISLLGIGLGQIIIGAALTVFTLGAGATIGAGLISEGVSDIITAIKDGIINRDFDWATWALMKVISVAVSVVCAGFKAIKDAARTAYAGAKNIATAGAKAFTQTTKQGWKIVAKKMGLEMAKGVGKEIVTNLVTYGINKTILPMIEEIIIEQVRNPIQDALINNSKVAEMLKLDEKSNDNHYESQIMMKAQMLLNPKTNSQLKVIATSIATRVADQKGLAVTRQVCTGLIGIFELSTFTSNFISKMNRSIDEISIKKEDKDSNETGHTTGVKNEVEREHVKEQQSCKNTDGDLDLNKLGIAEEQVQLQKKVRTTDNLSDQLAGMVSTNMLHVLKDKIISPITQMGVNYTVETMTSKVTKQLEENTKNYRAHKNVIHYQNSSNASSSHETGNDYNKKDIDKKVDDIIQKVENGEPAGLVHLGALSDATNRPIEVYDEKGRLKYTIGDTKKSKPIEVQYHAPENDSGTGHYTRKGCQEPFKTGKGTNMCLFNVIAEQTGQNPNQLKQKTVDIMKKNKTNLGNQIKHIKRLEMYDRSNLIEGGAQFNARNVDQAIHFLRNSNGVIGFDNINPAHNDIHIPFKGQTIHKLNAVADETGRQIEIYDKKGNLAYIIGEAKENSEPIQLQYHKPKGDISAEWFSSVGGNEKYYFHDPNDNTFYNIIGAQTGRNPTVLQTATLSRIERMTVPPGTCIENETLSKGRKTGFINEGEQGRVLRHAMETPVVKQKLAELNKYKPGFNDSRQYKKQVVHISEKELNLTRPAYGGIWENGKLQITWPVKDVVVVLQHYDKHQTNPDARVHIQTFYPKPP
ncbi:uncharacterized protein LOC126379352 isoform X1 [Pectinophora gossypiella]|uniref:uncharacterized protein LOC126379352 isoform X1 n=1 Tax=Pectinophora gossypiella TaxID=13191 RepID=UPI00214EB378|nr:uncharacterized protein LOC126379352 isoform X1 [Pectinophora gossypiella]XP_049884017.1 uncharacterized protein LOC126379352 isoform X1 [Pectinophora gossypiella]